MKQSCSDSGVDMEQVAWCGHLPVMRGGVATFTLQATQPFAISLQADPRRSAEPKTAEEWVGVCVSRSGTHVISSPHNAIPPHACSTGFASERVISYWLSFDPDSRMLKYGMGHHMEETTLFSCPLPDALGSLYHTCPKLVCLRGYTGPVQQRSLYETKLSTLGGQRQEAVVTLSRCPLIANPPSLVMDSRHLTLLDLGSREYLASSDLPPACQVLYQHLSQPCIDLNWCASGRSCRLTDAISYSLRTPGALLHTCCQAKAARLGPGMSPRQCYIRVSVGLPCGTSPGIPYVMEIWPPGHFSPIHNHGNAFGVVRLLHGSISTRIYNKHLGDDHTGREPVQEMTLNKGDITWFSPNWFQTHQLENTTQDFCCTVQGFQYADDDDVHWPYMQFKAPSGKLDHFLPISDFTFSSMREALLAEYSSALSQQECLRAGTCATGRETCVQARRTIDILVTAGRHDCRSQAAIVRQLTPDTPLDLINLPDSHTQGSRRESDDVITLL
ncbi:hypothetical protein CVIRNUC_007646 [Coccomyxa viridis]|uniref:Cysteine dioxygenase n=1 Tax=Coccomyxa viridis TaxID=1274662 RepID=A0AAV1IBG4_9CHLO|nr:hypothetical protein CVIRNUC_007646 [Coccomyxa viridis]